MGEKYMQRKNSEAAGARSFLRSSILTTSRLVSHRNLLVEQLRRELFDQHAGHIMGGVWLIIHPIFLMAVYVFVFALVFRTRIGGTHDMPLDYTTYILSGLIPWLTIQQALGKACIVLTQNAALIKQVVFPIEVLPARAVLSSLVPLAVMIVVLIAYVTVTYHAVPTTYLLLPILVVLLVPWLLGIGFLLSAATVFVRDVRELVTLFLTVGPFLLPVMYLPAWVPAAFKPLIYANPFSYIIWCFQDALYFGNVDHPWAWLVTALGGGAMFLLGGHFFQAARPLFGDAL